METTERRHELQRLRRNWQGALRQLRQSERASPAREKALLLGRQRGAAYVAFLGDGSDGPPAPDLGPGTWWGTTAPDVSAMSQGGAVTDPRFRAWSDIHDQLPRRWVTDATAYDPGARLWSISARGPDTGVPGTPSATIAGQGEDELAALTDLMLGLRDLGGLDRRMPWTVARGAGTYRSPRATAGDRSVGV